MLAMNQSNMKWELDFMLSSNEELYAAMMIL